MSSRRTILFIIAGVLLVVVLITQFLPSTGGGKATPTPTTVPVVVAKHDIPPYTILRVEDVRTTQIPANKVIAEDVFSGLREVAGMMTTTEIRSGNAVEKSKVLEPDPSWLAGDMRIFSFYVSTARVLGGQLRPGHHIDLLVTRGETRDQPAQSLWLAYSVWVVGVQQSTGADVLRPTAAVYNPTATPKGEKADSTGLLPVNAGRAQQGASNLVVVAADRETARIIGDYLGAQQFDAWVYIIPGETVARRTPPIPSKIDGVVFEDKNGTGQQETEELGLDEVTVTLFDEGGATLSTYLTDSGGKFYFEDLKPGTYRVEVTVPGQYVPTTPKRITQKVGEGVNYYLKFGLAVPPSPTAAPIPPTPVPATPTPAPTKAGEAVTATPAPPGTAKLHMSDREGGSAIEGFPQDVKEVWAVMTFTDCPKGMSFTIKGYFAPKGNQEYQLSSGTWEGGSGTKSVRIMPKDLTLSGGFEVGSYVTVLRTGPENAIRDLKLWSVTTSKTATPESEDNNIPHTGSDVERQR